MVFRAYCGQLLQLLVTLFSFWVVTLTGYDPLFFWGYGGVGVKKLSRGWGLFKTFFQALRRGLVGGMLGDVVGYLYQTWFNIENLGKVWRKGNGARFFRR
jgi:hypothetical protein